MFKVSVCCITYNHEQFLRQAIESVLMQETDFEVEMVIGEDCSTDGTRAIVEEYQQRYPDRIRALLPESNQGIMNNLFNTINACNGEYIALLEGDDYWVDPKKLALQVAVLQEQRDCVLCVHDAEIFADDDSIDPQLYSSIFPSLLSAQHPIITQQDLVLKGWGMPTASMLFRRSVAQLPEWYKGVYSGDYTLQLLLAQHGYTHYIPRAMSRYRQHNASITQVSNREKSVGMINKRIYELENYRKLLPKYSDKFNGFMKYWYFERSILHKKEKNYISAWTDYIKAITVSPKAFKDWIFRFKSG